jgi:hypothetical protein
MILCIFSDISIQRKYVHLLRLINKSKKDGFLMRGVGIWGNLKRLKFDITTILRF